MKQDLFLLGSFAAYICAAYGRHLRSLNGFTMVGEQGLEPWTSWSQTRRASQLRYTPTISYWLPRETGMMGHSRKRVNSRISPDSSQI